VTRGQLPQRAGSLGLNGGGTAAAVPPRTGKDDPEGNSEAASAKMFYCATQEFWGDNVVGTILHTRIVC